MNRTDHLRSPLAVFQTVDQPAVVSGNYVAAGFNFAIAIFALILAYMRHRESKVLGLR
jgi:ACS family pantothenate transporter-like MFS transporter